jgi:hypothetical protein
MTNKVLYIDVETGVEELRDQTPEELEQHNADSLAHEQDRLLKESKKEIAIAKLLALGLTPEDLANLS